VKKDKINLKTKQDKAN